MAPSLSPNLLTVAPLTLTSLQRGTTYRIEVEAVRKGEGADGQKAKVMGNFTTAEGERMPSWSHALNESIL